MCDIWGVKSAKTQYLPTSFARRHFQGRRIYRFITISELCLQLKNLTSKMTFLSNSIVVVAMFLLSMRKVYIPNFEGKMTLKELLNVVKFLIR